LKSRAPSRCFRIMRTEGMLEISAPELFADETSRSFETALDLLDRATRDPLVRFSLLLSLGLNQEGQARLDAARRLAEDFRLSSQEQNTTLLYLAAEELPGSDEGYALRRYLSRLGREQAESALNYVAVRFPEGTEQRENTLGLLTLLRRELSSGGALSLKELAVRGSDLLAARIVDKGPELGAVLARLLDHVLRVPADNRAERLLSLATDYKKA
jgi:tRNA nucleotidyltransferase domain 2 putative